jgi:4-hydroxy-tetrahydrodipicolinate reductase
MQIGLIGYGRMGKTIEQMAISRGHQICAIINSEEDWTNQQKNIAEADVVIEFTSPEAAYQNLNQLMDMGKVVICGTTGWLERMPYIIDKCLKNKTAFLYSSNFSIGVNILFEMNKQMAKWMSHIKGFNINLTEWHHIHKIDSPSGTAVTLLNDIIQYHQNFTEWMLVNNQTAPPNCIPVNAVREGEIFGIHQIQYQSENDLLTIRHEALNRHGFASGALLAAEWIIGRQGVFTMKDVLKM